jgi:hypothetical protein
MQHTLQLLQVLWLLLQCCMISCHALPDAVHSRNIQLPHSCCQRTRPAAALLVHCQRQC